MPTTTTSIEYFTFDGPVHVAVAVLVAGALLCLFVWSLRREQEVIGRRYTILFGVLRSVALLVALWMLLAPATIRSEKSQTRKSVAVVVDVSPSMLTLDPPTDAEDTRWALAANADESRTAMVSVDRALAAATLAEHRLAEATLAIRNEQPERVALEAATVAHDAIERTRTNTQAVAELLAKSVSTGPDALRHEHAAHILQILAGSDFEQLAKLASGLRRGHDSFQAGWRESLVDLQHQVSGVRRRLAELAEQIVMKNESTANDVASAELNATRQSPRLARVASFVESFDVSVLESLRERVDVRHASFDGSFTPLPTGQPAGTALRQALTATPVVNGNSDPTSGNLPVTDVTTVMEQLRRIQQEQPLAATFLFTDAAHNRPDGRDPRAAAADLLGSPVYVVPIGNTRHVRDVDLKAISAPGVVMKDDEVVIEATLQAFDCEGETVRVELLSDGEVIQDRELQLAAAITTQRVRFNARLDEVGLRRFQIRVAPLDGELSEENNFDQFEVNVTRDHIAVLLADEMPRWEFRYLAQLFRRDAKVECDELLFRPRMLATGRRAESKAFPATVDEWDQYDVVLLGDVSSQNLSVASQEALVAFVRERSGTLVMIAGDESMPQGYVNQPLEELLPVTKIDDANAANSPDGYAFHVTEDGWQHHALMIADTQDATRMAWDFISRNSPLYSLSSYRHARPTARTLIAAVPRSSTAADSDPEDNSLLCWQPVGRGRVVYLASPETYRLRFLRGDRLHYRFWGQLLRWAIASDLATGTQLVSIRTDRPDYRLGDRVEVVVRLKDEAGNAIVSAGIEAVAVASDDSRAAVPLQPDASEPGRYVGSFDRLPTGIYHVEPAGTEVDRLLSAAAVETNGEATATASFTVRSPLDREVLDTRSDRALAQQIADATGGQVLPPTAVSEVLALTNLDPIVTESTEVLPLWVQWKFLWIVFGCLFTEWAVRKQKGLS
jgi:hypothetical protein